MHPSRKKDVPEFPARSSSGAQVESGAASRVAQECLGGLRAEAARLRLRAVECVGRMNI